MHSNEAWLASVERLRKRYPEWSEAEMREFHNSCHYVSCEATDPIFTDIDDEKEPPYRRALNGRYWIFLYLQDPEYWNDNNCMFESFSAHLPHEPAIIAAALAFRPADATAWEAVEAWAWVYRHALMLEVVDADFEEWCAHQDPESSRRAVLLELRRSGHIAALSKAEMPSIYDLAHGNA